MKKIFFAFFFALLILLSISFTAFASIKLDGSIAPSEFEDANVEVQCDNGNSGCGLYVLVTYYKPLPDSSEIYLAFNAELYGEEIIADGPFGFEIYIGTTPVIKVHINNNSEFDSAYYDVQARNIVSFSSARCETLIMFKNHLPNTPEIYVRVIDNDGVPSRMFKINTVMPEPTTNPEETTKTKVETTKKPSSNPSFDFSFPFSLDDITKGTTNRSSQSTDKTTQSSSTQTKLDSTQSSFVSEQQKDTHSNKGSHKPSFETAASANAEAHDTTQSKQSQVFDSAVQYDLSAQTVNGNTTANKKRNMLISVSAIAIIITLAGAAIMGIKKKGKK